VVAALTRSSRGGNAPAELNEGWRVSVPKMGQTRVEENEGVVRHVGAGEQLMCGKGIKMGALAASKPSREKKSGEDGGG
jgi:hypothetical protein